MSSSILLKKKISETLLKASSDIIHGGHPAYVDFGKIDGTPPSLVGTGAAVYLDQNHANSITPDTRNIIAMSPEATILVKKKAFSSLKSSNNLRFMDKTEKMLLRATKALFAFKVQQIRAYESLTKFENYLSDNHMYSMNLLSSLIKEGSLIDISKLGQTVDEYVTQKLEAWLGEDMSTSAFDTTTVFAENFSSTGSNATFDVNTGQFVTDTGNRKTITNREYLKSISSSQAKAIIENKKNEFKYQYEGVDGHSSVLYGADENLWNEVGDPYQMGGNTAQDMSYLRGDSAKNFFNDLGDLLSYGAAAEQYDAMNQDIISIIKRNAFSADNQLSTWIVDPESPENYITGPGTGVMEVAIFKQFQTQSNYESAPSSASFTLTYPYRLGTILEDDIEAAIEDALNGTLGILDEMMSGGLGSEALSGQMPPIDGASIVSSAIELGGAGDADSSLDTDYIRDRLRTFYLGKPFINPSDPVHFYIRGNRTYTDYTSVGSSYPDESSEAPFDNSYMEIDDTILKAEYLLYTGQEIDIEQYKDLRRMQDNSFGMIHVFGGYVKNTSESFNGGYWDLSVSCIDNMAWLNWSRFSIQPSLSDPKNILEDPLTPFELTVDSQGQVGSSRELLYENKQLLQTGLLSYDSGLLAGQNAAEGNLLQGQYNGLGSSKGKKVMQSPSGFIYRWKTGIITATAGFQVIDSTGERQAGQNYDQQYSVTVANDVLNNLDIPNILSILIVGQPYNIETFIEQAFASHNISDRSGTMNPSDPLTGVLDTIRKQNAYYGNFHPYRMLSVNSTSAEQMINNAGVRELANSNVKNLQDRKRSLRRKVRDLQKSDASTKANSGIPQSTLIATLESEIATIDAAISKQVRIGVSASRALTSEEQVGIQISLTGSSTNLPISGDEDENHDVTRATMLIGAQRRIEDVRLNRDRNLFIVSDQYDAADIRPFILKLNDGGWKLFDSQYINSYQKCEKASNMLNLEFFCNTQGHLEFRPPLWNRVPLTVLKAAIKAQGETNKTIIPSFITDLFQTRIEGLYLQIHTLNVKIVLAALMMGRYPDSTLIPNMNLGGASSLKFFGVEINSSADLIGQLGNLFSGQSPDPDGLRLRQTEFETSEDSFLGENLKVSTGFQEKGDILSGDTETLLGIFDPIIHEQMGIVNDLQTVAGGTNGPPAQFEPEDLNGIRDTFKRQFGRDPAKGLGISDEFTDEDLIYKTSDADKLDRALASSGNILQKLKSAISARDSFVTMLQANLAKQEELNEIENFIETGSEEDDISVSEGALSGKFTDFLEKSATTLQTASDIITGKTSEGSVYDHLIEDDTRNLLGYGSGKRFIVKDEHITRATFTETPPDFTRVDIQGNAPLVGDGLNSAMEGLYFWAGATDFDLWRQYGYTDRSIDLPFISDTEGQARPYAVLELTMQKLNINRADVTVVGNEFYQPGDTVYIPTKGLLYYVKSVSHNFSYGSSFTTTLSLIYGHPPGTYVPSPLDVIGQQLVSDFLEDPSLIYRTEESDDNYRVLKPDSTLVFPSGGASAAELLAYSDNQIRFTNMMMDLTGSLSGTKYVLVRGFVVDPDDQEAVQDVSLKMSVVRSILEYPSQVSQSNPFSGGDDLLEGALSIATSIGSAFGGGSAPTTKSLMPMTLPNNMPVTPINPTKIIEQISYMKREDDTNPLGEIKCMDRKLIATFMADLGGEVDETKASGIFPKGGPSQGSWLDFRDEISGFNFGSSYKVNVIEVGIIDIPNSILTETYEG